MTRHFAAFAAALALISATPAAAQDYPGRAVSFVVPYAAGGATDMLARLLGQSLEQSLGKPFVIENRPGGSSALAAAHVSKSVPDGYTILMATSTTMAINASVFSKLEYRPLTDLTPVALIATSPFVLVVNNDVPARTVPDLVTLAQSKPGELTYGSSGPGSAHHLNMQLFSSMTGIKVTHVAYRGSVPAMNDVVAGHVKMMFSDMSSALPLIRSGKVRAMGVSTGQRLAGAQELPTLAEAGVPGYDAASWQMVVAPTKTPPDVLDKLHASMKAYQQSAGFKEQVVQRGLDPLVTPSRQDLIKFVEVEIERWRKVVESAGIADKPQ
jgi:tripartite-type tricarboxylate transporter receptor subunit TctC